MHGTLSEKMNTDHDIYFKNSKMQIAAQRISGATSYPLEWWLYADPQLRIQKIESRRAVTRAGKRQKIANPVPLTSPIRGRDKSFALR